MCLTEDYVRQLEKQLEDREQRIHDLRHTITQKDELLLATSEKLVAAERKRTELETALLNLATDKDDEDEEDNTDGNEDTFISSHCRAAKVDQENNELRYRLSHINTTLTEFHENFNQTIASETLSEGTRVKLKENVEKIGSLIYTPMKKLSAVNKANTNSETNAENEIFSSNNSENVQLKVKMELEHERRLRTQEALDDAERRYFALRRECDNKENEYKEVEKKLVEIKLKHDLKMKKAKEENASLENLLKLKKTEIINHEARAKDLVAKADEFEEMFNKQLDLVKSLQADLSSAYDDKKGLIKEMEALNEMFHTMEHRYVDQALKEYTYQDVDLNTDASEHATRSNDEKNEKIIVSDVLKKDEELGNNSAVEDCCFKEVKTKNGTRMVLSVSKTFIKLRDLILEKKGLEDQVEKMKAVNTHLCSRVNRHEEKLYNITDELNKTWCYVSTLKLQHKELHTNEEVLRAELTEKRQLLAKLREELEISRESWNIVKKKTADSEREWRALRDEFAARRRMFPSSSSESGYSDRDCQLDDDENNESNDTGAVKDESSVILAASLESIAEETSKENENPLIEVMEEKNLDFEKEKPKNSEGSCSEKKDTATSSIEDKDTDRVSDPDETEEECIPLFIPSMNYMAQVPPDMLPPLFPSEIGQENGANGSINPIMVESYQELYQKLIASTARSAAIANRLAEVHRSIKISNNNKASNTVADAEEEDSSWIEPRTDDESIIEHDDESELISELEAPIENVNETDPNDGFDSNMPVDDDRDDDSDLELEDLGLSQEAIETALASSRFADDSNSSTTTSLSSSRRTSIASSPPLDSDEEDETYNGLSSFATGPVTPLRASQVAEIAPSNSLSTFTIPPAPPLPTFSLVPPPATVTVRPTFNYNYANLDSLDDTSEDESQDEDPAGTSENSTAVTRFLIKHLPKQLSKLRNDKAELEEKIRDLEATISNQSQAMLEMGRRVEIYKKEAETSRKWNSSLSLNLGKVVIISILIPHLPNNFSIKSIFVTFLNSEL